MWRVLSMAAIALFSAAIASGVGGAEAPPRIENIRFGVDQERTRIVLELNHTPSYDIFALSEGGERLVVDLPSVDWEVDGSSISPQAQHTGPAMGAVVRYRFAQHSPERSRLVLDLAEPAQLTQSFVLAPDNPTRPHRLVLDLASGGGVVTQALAAPRREHVVVIDPGHGGRDPGALGVRTRVREKDLNLLVAQDLRRRLEQLGGYRVVMTREDDRTLTLEERVRIAREAEAELFISIHADSAPGARGASVYTLAERSERRVHEEILADDNWLIDANLEDHSAEVGHILVDLAQRATKNRSSDFAELLIPQLRSIGPVVRNTRRSAGYYVLLAPDVPAVLLETGFLSNASDERRLKSRDNRQRIADSVAAAIEEFFRGGSERV